MRTLFHVYYTPETIMPGSDKEWHYGTSFTTYEAALALCEKNLIAENWMEARIEKHFHQGTP